MTNLIISNEKSNLQKFYEGWPHFQSLNVCVNFIVFKVPHFKQVADCIKKAEQRIAEKKLPLEVVSGGRNFNTFIVKERSVTHA